MIIIIIIIIIKQLGAIPCTIYKMDPEWKMENRKTYQSKNRENSWNLDLVKYFQIKHQKHDP
jgi:hypothetical protein